MLAGGFMIKEHLSANDSNQIQTEQSDVMPTPVRHDNSGAGASTDDNPVQDHFQRAVQHLGL